MDPSVFNIAIVSLLLVFGGGTLFLLSISPIGKALAARILGRRSLTPEGEDTQDELRQLRAEVDALRTTRDEVAELAERLDFAERLLARQREPNRIGPA